MHGFNMHRSDSTSKSSKGNEIDTYFSQKFQRDNGGFVTPGEQQQDEKDIDSATNSSSSFMKPRYSATTTTSTRSMLQRNSISARARETIEELTSLRFDLSQLHGRDDEFRRLKEACGRVATGDAELALISGPSGIGKSVLALKLKDYCGEGNVFQGKFDFRLTADSSLKKPYQAILDAYERLFANIYDNRPKLDKDILRDKLTKAFGGTDNVLVEMLPSLRKLIERTGTHTTTENKQPDNPQEADLQDNPDDDDGGLAGVTRGEVGSTAHKDQFFYLFRCLTKVVSQYLEPLVLVIDDLQWADADSLDLLSKLLTSVEKSQLLIVGTHRDGEEANAVVTPWLKDLKQEMNEAKIQEISLGPLSSDTMNALVSQVLKSQPSLTSELAAVVHRKTNGNPFFIFQFLTSLRDTGILDFNLGVMQWQWDIARVEELFVTDNVLQDILQVKLRNLPSSSQYLCQIAACLGVSFDEELLLLAVQAVDNKASLASLDVDAIQKSLQQLEDLGIFQRSSDEGSPIHFSHDQIQFSAASMLSRETTMQWKAAIGRNLLLSEFSHDPKWLNMIADLCNSNLGVTMADRVRLIELNRRAGIDAMNASAYPAAQSFFSSAIKLFEEERENNDELYLLHGTMAEACYCAGDFASMQHHLDQVLNQADFSMSAKLRLYATLVVSLSAQAKWDECISKGLAILDLVGTKIPKASTVRIVFELVKTRRLVGSCPSEQLCGLPLLNDEVAIQTERIFDILATAMYVSKSNTFPVLAFRHVQLCIRHGVGTYSPVPFALFGCILCGMIGDLKEGYRMGQVAMAILTRLPNRACASRTLLLFNAFVYHWQNPVHTGIKKYHRGYEIGMQLGDIESAMYHKLTAVISAFCCGVKLEVVEQRGREACKLMRAYKQASSLNMAQSFWQTTLNLLGQSADPVILEGEAVQQVEFLQWLEENKHEHGIAILYSMQMQLAYFMGAPLQTMEEFLEKSKELPNVGLATVQAVRHIFYEGMAAYLLAEKTGKRRKWKRRATANKQKMKSWANQGNPNVTHTLALLQAEEKVLEGRRDKAKKYYEQAITLAGKSGYQQDRALAHERSGLNYLALEDTFWAKHHLSSAHDCYLHGER